MTCVDPLGLSNYYLDPYLGAKNASAYLRNIGVPRNFRKQVLESSEIHSIKVRKATNSEYGLRYYGGVNAYAKGRYFFETFPASTEMFAIKTEWNQMKSIAQFKVNPGSVIIEGRASAQGGGLPGGQIQKYISNLENPIGL